LLLLFLLFSLFSRFLALLNLPEFFENVLVMQQRVGKLLFENVCLQETSDAHFNAGNF